MFRNPELLNPGTDSSNANSEDDAEKFSKNEIDDENTTQNYTNSSLYNEKQLNSFDNDFQNSGSNGHSLNIYNEANSWSPSFSVPKAWKYRSVLNEKSQTRLKINLNKVKKVRVKKPSVGIARSKTSHSSNDANFLKKRVRLTPGATPLRKRSTPKNRLKNSLFGPSGAINGLNAASTTTLNAVSNSIEVPRVSSSSDVWTNHGTTSTAKDVVDGALNDNQSNVGEYAQYLELKPSVKFKCYRCGTSDFSTMATLQGHIATCSGPASTVTANQESTVRTMKPLASSTSVSSPNLRITRQVFLCSSCGTYYQNYNLYIHMRDKHNKQICLFCRTIFLRSEQLWEHLVSAHKLNSVEYSSAFDIRTAFKSSFYITCCTCNSIFANDEPFNEHICRVDDGSSAMDAALYAGCKPSNTTASVEHIESGATSLATVAADSIADSPRRISTSSVEDDDESRIKFQNSYTMSRDSTLDFIGVPEEHTVNSLADDEMADDDVVKVKESVADDEENKVPVLSASAPVCTENTATPDGMASVCDGDDRASIVNEMVSRQDQSPSTLRPEADESTSETDESSNNVPVTLPANAMVVASSPLQLLADEDGNKSDGVDDDAAATPDIDDDPMVSDDEKHPVNDEVMSVAETPLDADSSIVAPATTPPTTLHSQCSTIENEEPPVETPAPPEEKETVPAPLPMALMLDKAVDSLSVTTLINECVRTSCLTCLYCANVTSIAVNGCHLVEHLLAEHRFMPTKNEDDSQSVIRRLESAKDDLKLVHMNASFASHQQIRFDGTFACLQCPFTTPLFKELCHHKRRTHHKIIFICIMCKCNFLFYSQLLCHLCPGIYLSENLHTLTYHCCFCDVDLIPSAFRLMVHLRKVHHACDICLSRHADQSELYTHMIKQHKMSHLCYKCNLAWRSRDDINKHLFWKHGTESVLCQRCLQKKWPHAYHFCIPASTYTCDECNRIFSKAVALTVHRRAHNGEFPFACDLCEQRSISRRLLAAHKEKAHGIMREPRPEAVAVQNEAAEKDEDKVDGGDANETPATPCETRNADDDEGKDSRSKKRRKRMKSGNEKPLLDELPPLNLSSESENESADDEQAAKTDSQVAPSAEALKPTPPLSPSALADDNPPTEEEIEPADQPEAIADQLQQVAANLPIAALSEPIAAQADEDAEKVLTPPLQPPASTPPPSECDVLQPAEAGPTQAELIEKMLNCLIVEHSYCIPDSIFVSETTANVSAMSEGSDNVTAAGGDGSSGAGHQLLSPKMRSSKHDKSCSKSVTPRKRKHTPKKDSSSSDSSSDSDSSSSSCGSNCSCNKSGSNCSSSSSSESTTPEKRSPTKKEADRSPSNENASANNTSAADNASAGEYSLLSVPESDLDTEVPVSDEDFYEEHPFYVPPQPPQSASLAAVAANDGIKLKMDGDAAPAPYENKLTISRNANAGAYSSMARRNSRPKKSKKKPKITINLGGIKRSNANSSSLSARHQSPYTLMGGAGAATANASASSLSDNRMTSSFGGGAYTSTPNMADSTGAYQHHQQQQHYRSSSTPSAYSNCVGSGYSTVDTSTASPFVSSSGHHSGRLSKRKRVKNRFYGYSSSDENSGHELSSAPPPPAPAPAPAPPLPPLKTTIQLVKKRPPLKKSLAPSRPPRPSQFVGIRARKPPTTNLVIRKPMYFQQQQQQRMMAAAAAAASSGASSNQMYRISSTPSNDMLHRQQQLQQHQQRNFLKPVVPEESSDDSDSDEKGHKLVINLPATSKEKQQQQQQAYNNRLSYGFSTAPSMATDAAGDNRWYVQQQQQQQLHHQQQPQLQQQGLTTQSTPTKKEVYCFCRCPYDEVSEMIACDGPNCPIEWFHFECVGVMAAPKGQWFCPRCRKNSENIAVARSFV